MKQTSPSQIRDDVELQRLRRAGSGFIYNDFSGAAPSGSDHNVLHTARCYWLERANTNVPKLFFTDLPQAVAWLNANRGPEGQNWKRCGTCGATS